MGLELVTVRRSLISCSPRQLPGHRNTSPNVYVHAQCLVGLLQRLMNSGCLRLLSPSPTARGHVRAPIPDRDLHPHPARRRGRLCDLSMGQPGFGRAGGAERAFAKPPKKAPVPIIRWPRAGSHAPILLTIRRGGTQTARTAPILSRPMRNCLYVHPTTYLDRDRWNAPLLPGGETEFRTRLFVQSQASAFNERPGVWAPRYRQAAFGAFLLESKDAQSSRSAYRHLAVLSTISSTCGDPRQPDHSRRPCQGALHLAPAPRRSRAEPIARLWPLMWSVGRSARRRTSPLWGCHRAGGGQVSAFSPG